ncbi:DMT family transporter [Rhizobium paknamense]|uniref:Drug/metabolite transporter (DMT)-like permease n=1 Tax=Rhizobium paknamense TaxID=1206817 RepID=A0ABU0ID79_9HYPH|nr:DMT family transporter [Rhizobium paknamense]MDQ0456198.1 drug/metabolite transporter (DMT)-like permease [Rhizobium paknamense]
MKSTPLGYLFAIIAYTVFSCQDGISKHLGDSYSPVVVATIRYWAFAGFALVLASRAPGGLRAAVRSQRPVLQVLRGVLLGAQIVVSIWAFRYVGLAQSQAVFASGPIFVALLSVPLLGEKVGWRRWSAISVGLVGVLLILSPKADGFTPLVVLPLACALCGALYGILTRLVSRVDLPETSFFYMCMVGFAGSNLIAPFVFEGIAQKDWFWMLALCCTGIVGHFCLIKAYDNLSAVQVQPIAYWQLVLASLIAVVVFGESLKVNMVLGSLIVVAAGLFTVWREHVVAARNAKLVSSQ